MNKFAKAAEAANFKKKAQINTPVNKVVSHADIMVAEMAASQQDKKSLVLPLESILINEQIRTEFDELFISELANNIKENGQLQAINVSETEGGAYILTSGENRFRAITLLKEKFPENLSFHKIRVTVDNHANNTERMLKQFHENVQRNDLSQIDEARAIAYLMKELEITSERKIAATLNIPHKRVNRRLSLLAQPIEIQNAIESGDVTANDIRNGNVEIVVEDVAPSNDLSHPHFSDEKSKSNNQAIVKKKKPKPKASVLVSTLENILETLNSFAEEKGVKVIDRPDKIKPTALVLLLTEQLDLIKKSSLN